VELSLARGLRPRICSSWLCCGQQASDSRAWTQLGEIEKADDRIAQFPRQTMPSQLIKGILQAPKVPFSTAAPGQRLPLSNQEFIAAQATVIRFQAESSTTDGPGELRCRSSLPNSRNGLVRTVEIPGLLSASRKGLWSLGILEARYQKDCPASPHALTLRPIQQPAVGRRTSRFPVGRKHAVSIDCPGNAACFPTPGHRP